MKKQGKETANKAVKMGKKGKKSNREQQDRHQPPEEQLNLEELAYQSERVLQADSSEEDEGYTMDFEGQNDDTYEEETQTLSQPKRRRTHLTEDGARVSQAGEDKLPSQRPKTKTRIRASVKDSADEEVAGLPQAEQSQGQSTPNPSLPSYLPLPLNSTLVGAGIQNTSSANANHSITYSNDGDFTPNSDRGRQLEVPDDGITSINPVSRLERLTKIKNDSVIILLIEALRLLNLKRPSQLLNRGSEIIISQETISITKFKKVLRH